MEELLTLLLIIAGVKPSIYGPKKSFGFEDSLQLPGFSAAIHITSNKSESPWHHGLYPVCFLGQCLALCRPRDGRALSHRYDGFRAQVDRRWSCWRTTGQPCNDITSLLPKDVPAFLRIGELYSLRRIPLPMPM